MTILQLLIAILVAATIASLVIPWLSRAIEEPFQGSSSCPAADPKIEFATEQTATMPTDWATSVETGKSFFNRLADVLGESNRPDWSGTAYTKTEGGKTFVDDTKINTALQQALQNLELRPIADPRYGPNAATYTPTVTDLRVSATTTSAPDPDKSHRVAPMLGTDKPTTGFGQSMSYVEERYPKLSGNFEKATQCQTNIKIDSSNSRVAACNLLGTKDYEECGVCIKASGTAYNQPGTAGKYMGGLFVSARDKQKAVARGQPTQYKPSIGSCPEGYFFVDKASCLKAVNRLNCEEYGEIKGFESTATKISDGTSTTALATQCAACSRTEDPTYIYNPPTSLLTSPSIYMRVAVPAGTGRNRIIVLNPAATRKELKNLVFRSNIIDTTLEANTAENMIRFKLDRIQRSTTLHVLVIQEFPHRPRGESEVFFVKPTADDATIKAGFGSQADAAAYAKAMGCSLATQAQLTSYNQSGGQVCGAGWIADDDELVYTAHLTADLDKSVCPINFDKAGVTSSDVTTGAGCWCYGIKPAQSDVSDTKIPSNTDDFTGITNNQAFFSPSISNFYEYVKRTVDVDESLQKPRYSIYGESNAAPNWRGVAIQIEMDSTVPTAYERRREPVERFITKVGTTPITTTSGTTTTRIAEYLTKYKRLGLFNQSQMIKSPKPEDLPAIAQNQYWLWSPTSTSSLFDFTVELNAYFNDPVYPEDTTVCPTGAFITSKKGLDLYTISPCEGNPDKLECLQHLFKKVGGTSSGTLYPTSDDPTNEEYARYLEIRYKDYVLPSGTINDLPAEKRTEAEMEAFLQSFMDVLQRGIFPADTLNDKTPGTLNEKKRARLLKAGERMWGKDPLTPCEMIVEKSDGSNQVIPKQELDDMCYDYLYRQTGPPSTYTDIGNRYSGIQPTELASDATRAANPYKACQPSGSWAPIRPDGTPNREAIDAIKAAMNTIMTAPSSSIKTQMDAAKKVFNDIYQTANNSSASEADQADALERCYGVVKKQYLSNCKGVQALLVRILGSAFRFGMSGDAPSRIVTTGITVKDVSGNPININTTTMEFNKTANLTAGYSDFKKDGDYDVGESKITLDFGATKNASSVEYKVASADLDYKNGIVVQLLSDANTVAAQRVLTLSAVSETVTFTSDDFRPLLPYDALTTGLRFRLETAIYPGYFLTSTKEGIVSVKNSTESDDYNNSILVTDKDKNDFGTASWSTKPIFALRSNNLGQRFVSVATDNAVRMDPLTDRRFQTWSSWAIQPALNGAPGFVSLESATFPGYYIVPYNDGKIVQARIEALDLSSDFHKFRACWRIIPVD